MKVNVLTVDEREVVRLGVGQMLLQTTSCVCVGTCTTPVEALNHIRDDPGAADVVLLGLQTGLNHRGDLCGLLDLGLRIVLFRITSDPYINLNPIMKRVAGIIEPTSSARDLEEALVAAAFRGGSQASTGASAAGVRLSPRQQQILLLYASGEPAKRLATITGLSLNTVRDYIDRIRVKYALAGRPILTRIDFYHRAVEDGLLPDSSMRTPDLSVRDIGGPHREEPVF